MKKERRLFAVGDLCVDVLQEITGSAEFGKEKALRELDFSIGGNAANFAVIGAKLGLKPTLVSVIGSDFATPFLKKSLAKAKVHAALIKSREQNAFSIITVNRRGERAIQSAKNCLEEIDSARVARLLLHKLRAGDIVFFGGFYHLHNMRNGFGRLLAKIKKKGAIVCFDTCFDTTGRWDISAFLPLIDFLFVNDIELLHIARGSTALQRVGFIFKKGVGCVVVKEASKGATLYRKGLPERHFASVADKVVDTTGAGDAFNAGFAYGLLKEWSLCNCTLAGNFVAARKIRGHGLAAPTCSALERFVAIKNTPELVIERNYRNMSLAAAQIVAGLLQRKPDASLGLATGETPKMLYRLLVSKYKKREIDFSKAKFFALDEYAGLRQDNKSSFSYYLMKNFLGKVNAKKQNIFLLDGAGRDLRWECARHEAAIRKNGVDLCILGIGRNGHVAFNEPGSCPYSVTRAATIKPETRKVNGKNFKSGLAPPKALTVGLRTIRENSGQILLIADGKHKAKAIAATLRSKDFLHWPAVALKPHRNFTLIVDKAAASCVSGRR